MATNGGDVLASELMAALLTGEDVNIPTIDFSGSEYTIPGDINSDAYDVLVRLSDSDLTTGAINGTGAFDKLMVGVAAQLQREYDAGRITGVEYTKAYIALTGSALSSSLQYLLSRDAAYWQAVQAQAASVTARVQLATAKIQNAAVKFEAMTAKANYALSKLKLSSLDVEFATGKYNLENLLPSQLAQTIAQTSLLSYDLTTVKPTEVANLNKQGALLDSQKLGQDTQNDTAIYNLENLLPAQLATANAQKLLIDKQKDQVVQQTTNLVAEALNIPKQGDVLDKQALQIVQQTANLVSEELGIDARTALVIQQKTNLVSEELNIPKQGALIDSNKAVQDAQKLSIDKANSISDYNLATVLPSQVAMTNAQKLGQDKQNDTAAYNLSTILVKQAGLLDEQIASAAKDTDTKTYNLTEIMPAQKLNLQEQAEAQRAQTLDTRSNGVTAVAGSIGRQNALYAQQVVSYQKDAELKAGKVFSDIWTVRKTVDEGTGLPAAFDTANIQSVMSKIMASNGL